jgi:general secretion pathway protein B
MSLILEALRKSEAERRRGQAPDLRTELPPVAPPRAHALPRWSWAVFALALLVLAWLLLARSGSGPAGGPLAPPADTSVATGSAGPARDPGTVVPSPRIVIEPVASAPPGDFAAAGRRDPAPEVPVPGPAVTGEPGVLPPAATERAPIASSTPSTPAPTATPAPPAPPAPGATDTRLLVLSELSAEERRQLPPLKLSMHMWSEDPARRFVILDGHRLAEGDRVGPAVIDAIRGDDVVLAWNGMRLRLSLH